MRNDSKEKKHFFTFRPHEKLKRRADFSRVRIEGKRYRSKHFAINYVENGLMHHRLGIIVPKKYYKKAVHRNRIKRCVREWFRLHKYYIAEPYRDIVVVGLGGIENFSCRKIAEELSGLCTKAGLGSVPVRF